MKYIYVLCAAFVFNACAVNPPTKESVIETRTGNVITQKMVNEPVLKPTVNVAAPPAAVSPEEPVIINQPVMAPEVTIPFGDKDGKK